LLDSRATKQNIIDKDNEDGRSCSVHTSHQRYDIGHYINTKIDSVRNNNT
jgi:hypothetical protein